MKYDAGGLSIEIFSTEAFWIDLMGRGAPFARTELTELRAIIDQALNTSAEELEASGDRQTLEADEPFTPLRDPRIDFR